MNERPNERTTTDIYERILDIVWRRLVPTFGQRTVAAITRSVIAHDCATYPILQHLTVDETGFRWEQFKAVASSEEQQDVDQALDCLLDDLFDALSDLIGRLIIGRVITEVETEARKGEADE